MRDKIAASKRKGMWMGGNTPLGYDSEGRTLVINPAEAETVRTIFRLYGELGSVNRLRLELDRRGIVSKRRVAENGATSGGKPIGYGNLHEMLTNPVYIGQIRHKGMCHAGLHEPIINQALWEETQARLEANRQGRKDRRFSEQPAPLLEKIFDENGDRLVPTHAQKQGRRYRYYTSYFLITRDPADARKGWRLPAPAFETTVASAVSHFLQDQTALAKAWREADLPFEQFQSAMEAIQAASATQPLTFLERVELSSSGLLLTISLASLIRDGSVLTHQVPMTVRRRGEEMRMVLDDYHRTIDPVLVSAMARGHLWFGQLTSGTITNLSEIVEREGVSSGRVSQLMKLALLSPKIVKSIVGGTQPADLTTKTFAKIDTLPVRWAEQEALLGF